MSKFIQAIRGMHDVLPSDSFTWQYIETLLKSTLNAHGYHEIRFPILEQTELFKRTIGEVTDIVEKEMYTFLDRNQDSLSLRPEGTASCVRACIEHGLLRHSTQRLWYMGPFFRHERPQKGRCRQFHQCGAEVYGIASPDIDAEIIALSAELLNALGLSRHVTLQLNSLGSKEARRTYRDALTQYFHSHQHVLDDDSKRRLLTNPLRILDTKNPDLKFIVDAAPKLIEFLDEDSKQHFDTLLEYLTISGIRFELNPTLVRGLDYYSRTVFEWVTTELGAQGTVCGGGRYDHLVEQLGGPPTPAIGFSLGMERAILLHQHVHTESLAQPAPDFYIVTENEACFQYALELKQRLFNQFGTRFSIVLHAGGGSLKNQFKKADKSGAEFALILGEDERSNARYSLKSLRAHEPQRSLTWSELVSFISEQKD